MHGGALGLDSKTVRVVAYDERWPGLFQAEVDRLKPFLKDLRLVLEHSGSTAVPGLAAKPILDILGGRSPEVSRELAIEQFQRAGYTYRGEQGIPGRDFFRRGEPRSYHLHLTTIGSEFWNDHRDFRDYLRAHPDAREAYAALKFGLARQFPTDREAYIEAKTEFVNAVLRKARA
jgi:GrpB-like predicted nucleotidyltransferase (UPF0157 family)